MGRGQIFLSLCRRRHTAQSGQHRVLCSIFAYLLGVTSFPAWALSTAEEITQEATAANSETNHPLPLMGSWSAASNQWDAAAGNLGYTPYWQMQMIGQGRHLLPWFQMPDPVMLCTTQDLPEQRLQGLVDLLRGRDKKRCRAKSPDCICRRSTGTRHFTMIRNTSIFRPATIRMSSLRTERFRGRFRHSVPLHPGRRLEPHGERAPCCNSFKRGIRIRRW